MAEPLPDIAAPVVTVGNVTHAYKKVLALDDVALRIPAGQMVGLLGPDGVGKSTLLALIAGARKLQTGTLDVLDGDMASTQHRSAVGPRIAYMPQGLGKNEGRHYWWGSRAYCARRSIASYSNPYFQYLWHDGNRVAHCA